MRKILTLACAVTWLIACKTETPKTNPNPGAIAGSGVLISNEGAFQGGTGTISFYKPETSATANNVFQEVNGIPAGNLLQSLAHVNNNIYMVLNGSNKISVCDDHSLEQIAEIAGFSSPRYMMPVSARKAYVTNWGTSSVSIVDLASNTITGSIPCGQAPEKMAFDGNLLYVANSGGIGTDSTVFVIDVIQDQVVDTVFTGYNPNSLTIDANGNLWVMCAGISDWNDPTNDVAGNLMKIDLANNNAVLLDLDFPSTSDHPADLTIDGAGQNVYWLSNDYFGAIYVMSIADSFLPQVSIAPGGFYSLGVDPVSDEIYASDPKDYQRDGVIYRLTTNGQLLDSARVGLIPNGFLFK